MKDGHARRLSGVPKAYSENSFIPSIQSVTERGRFLGRYLPYCRAAGASCTFKRTVLQEDNLCKIKYSKLSILPTIEDTFMLSFKMFSANVTKHGFQ